MAHSFRAQAYAHPTSTGWTGSIEPASRRWVGFLDLDGKPYFFTERGTSGAVLIDATSTPPPPPL
jgi:hypothetical protein